MLHYLEQRKKDILDEAKTELKLLGLEWNDNYLDLYNFSPDFDFGEEENITNFRDFMARIDELDMIINLLKN